MVKCQDCEFRKEDYLTSLQGRGLYRFSYCQELVHDCKVVDPDVKRRCKVFKKRGKREGGLTNF